MAAYYNENDSRSAAWLRQLIADGMIPEGEVDERDIRDVVPSELSGYRQCHFFAGIGGWPYALRLAGWPDDRPVWTGSCPCQPFSQAGGRAGFADERHLWPAWFHLIEQCRPAVIYGEQVATALEWLDLVFDDLEGAGYTCRAEDLCAAGVGAPHIRQRLFWMADADGGEPREAGAVQPGWKHGQQPKDGSTSDGLADAGGTGLEVVGLEPAREERASPERGCAVGGVADAEGGRRREERPHGGWGDAGDQAQGLPAGYGSSGGDLRPNATDGFWRDADWLGCRDGKWRPVIASHVGVVDGLPNFMVHSSIQSACGEEWEMRNAAQTEGTTAQGMSIVRSEDGTEAICWGSGRSRRVPPQGILRQGLHGCRDAERCVPEPKPQPVESGGDSQGSMRDVRAGRKAARSPHRRGPYEQRSVELEDVVSVLPSALALAELHERWRDADAMRALCAAICEAGAMPCSPEQAQEIWQSLGREDQDRIRMGLGYIWVARSFSPISVGETARMGRLRGYGNAIVPQLAAEFVMGSM